MAKPVFLVAAPPHWGSGAFKTVMKRADDIEDEVNELIKSGWQPFGSPCVLQPTPELEQADTVLHAMARMEAD